MKHLNTLIAFIFAATLFAVPATAKAQDGGRGLGAIVNVNTAYIPVQHVVNIEWSTINETEYQVQYFIIEQTINGSNAYQVGLVQAAGTPSEKYVYICDSLTEGLSYYRITVVDVNGALSSTGWKAVQVENSSIHLYPTILNTNDCIKVTGLEEGCQIHIYGSKGRVNGEFNLQPGCNSIHFAGQHQGLYHYFIFKGDQMVKSGKFEVVSL